MDRRTFLESVAGLAVSIPMLGEKEQPNTERGFPCDATHCPDVQTPVLLADFTTDKLDKDGHPWRQRAIHIMGIDNMDRLDKFCAAEDILRAYRIDDMLLLSAKSENTYIPYKSIVFNNWCVAKIDASGKIISETYTLPYRGVWPPGRSYSLFIPPACGSPTNE